MESAPELVLAVMVVVIALSGYSALYFATRYEKRSPAVVALVSLMGIVFLIDVLWGSVYYVSCVAERAVTCDYAQGILRYVASRHSGCLRLLIATRGSAAILYGADKEMSYRVWGPDEVWIQSTTLMYSVPRSCAIQSNRDAQGS